jgi:hypothetical protein
MNFIDFIVDVAVDHYIYANENKENISKDEYNRAIARATRLCNTCEFLNMLKNLSRF